MITLGGLTRTILGLTAFFLVMPCNGFSQVHAPPDAYEDESGVAYYGTEDPWNRRAYQKNGADDYKEYGRFGQRQMLDIVEGRLQDAVEYCHRVLETHPNDPESLFNLAIAYTQMADLGAAKGAMKKALNAGLPLERFLAGPRELLRPLTETEEFRRLVTQRDIRLIHGPLLGQVTDHSAAFWIRTARPSGVRLILSHSKDFVEPIEIKFQTQIQQDFTGIAKVDGLHPETTYYYDVIVGGKSSLRPAFPSFRTYPPAGSPGRVQIGFGGGAMYTPHNERMWAVIRSHHPSAFLFLGDNVYIDMPWHVGAIHQYTYYRRQSNHDFREMVASTPIYAIWDDHDAGIDDIFLGPYRDRPSWKMPVFRIFRNNWNNPAYGDPEWPGCWFQLSIGDIDIFMLDGRFYRTNPLGPDPTMLGPVQKAWLKKKLRESRATFKVLASPVPWAFSAKPGKLDTWNGYRAERKELFDFIAENGINGVILISADRHRSDAWRIERDGAYPLYEFESSRLTNDGLHPLVPQALFGYNEKCSFGWLSFDTGAKDPTVTYQIISIDDEVIHSLTLHRSQIAYP